MFSAKDEFRKREATIASEQNINKKITLILNLAFDFLYKNSTDYAQKLLDQAQQLAKSVGNYEALQRIQLGKETLNYFHTDYTLSMNLTNQSIVIFTENSDKEALAETYVNLGVTRWRQGEYSQGLEYTFKSIHLFQEIEAKAQISHALYLLGNYYLELGDIENAKTKFEQAQQITDNNLQFRNEKSRCLIGFANVALQQSNYDEAMKCLQEAESIQKFSGNQSILASIYNGFGKIYAQLDQFEIALKYFSKSLDIRLTFPDKHPLISTYLDLGECCLMHNKPNDAINYLENALQWSTKLLAKVKLYRTYYLMSQVYEALNKPAKAYEHLKQYNTLKELVIGKDAILKIRNLETQITIERIEKESEIYRLKNVELRKLNEEIERKNRSITDSIEYARRIQDAMLPIMSANEDQTFILLKPLDIVSGDFYWFTNVPNPQGNTSLRVITAVDCTGHGVPGAFMSMIGNDLLDNIVIERGITSPHEVLNHLHQGVLKALKQKYTNNHDGMDISLVVIDDTNHKLYFAGANNPLVYIQDNQLHIIKGDKFGIGGGIHFMDIEFQQHCVSFANSPITFYIFSDGFQDQFGGPKNKKFMRNRLYQLLFEIHHLPLTEQKTRLNNTLKNWMGEEPQVDDILVMGVKIGDKT